MDYIVLFFFFRMVYHISHCKLCCNINYTCAKIDIIFTFFILYTNVAIQLYLNLDQM